MEGVTFWAHFEVCYYKVSFIHNIYIFIPRHKYIKITVELLCDLSKNSYNHTNLKSGKGSSLAGDEGVVKFECGSRQKDWNFT